MVGTEKIPKNYWTHFFPNFLETLNPQIQEIQQTPNTRNVKKTTPRHIITTLPKTSGKKKNLKNKENGHVTYRGKNIKITAMFS